MKKILKVNEYNEVTELRNLSKMNHINDGTRTLFESIAYPEVIKALDDWKSNNIENCTLIGGLALSYYVKPRTTSDIDILFATIDDIPTELLYFKRHRKNAFQHNNTHVELEVLSPEFLNIPADVVNMIIKTSNGVDGIKVASPSGLIASKLFTFRRIDQADIENLLINCEIDMSPFNLTDIELDKFNSIKNNLPQ